MSVKDHFSKGSTDYARYRPRYPDALFDFVCAQCPKHGLAWDCATGSGQAAIELARTFERVIATDGSAEQLKAATPAANVEYRQATAEASGLEEHSIDLICVAQAFHWFDARKFFAEVRRVAGPGALLAVWGYALHRLAGSGPEIDALNRLIVRYYSDVVGDYWPPERRLVEKHYRDIGFPFEEVPAPEFRMELAWNCEEFIGYLATWSATRRFQAATGQDPLDQVRDAIQTNWGEPEIERSVEWPLFMRVGRVS